MGHHPVLADEVAQALLPALGHGGVLVDATLGRAGHAHRLLDAAESVELIGIDRDPDALEASWSNLAAYAGRIRLVRDDFQNLEAVLERLGVAQVAGVLLDLGVSSPQLDDPQRGFSYRERGPLDMRMDPTTGPTAHDVVNRYEVSDLARVIRRYGEERFARRIASAIERARPVEDTLTLAEVVRNAIPAATRRTGGHPAKRTFQAIRIEVNRELDALETVLPGAVQALRPGGRLVVLAYHSLEDRIVKRYFVEQSKACTCPPDFPVCACGANASLRLVTRRAVMASPQEVEGNPRASSVRMRVAEKLEAAA
ncbi:MAG: 16S rRNA (cytosine(1402)-N(4))-methyltransferase RsmH [Actinomycetota bacterium]|nr:16S rRNA (cytosine(1402)-N(4))-methyltransferase RsmH [Actinomycetota bacterium]